MKKFAKITAVVLVAVMALAVLVACGPASDPKKAAEALTKHGYTVESAIASEGTLQKAACDLFGVTFGLEAGSLTAFVSGQKGTEESGEAIVILYFADSSTAKSVWENKFFTELRKSKEEAKEEDNEVRKDTVIKISGSIIYFGSKAAVKAAR